MSHWLRALIMGTLLLCGLTACSSEDPNPELKDPIFADLIKRLEHHTKGVDEGTNAVKDLVEKLEKAEPNSIEKKDIQKELAKTRIKLRDNQQWATYYKIRVERRKVMDKIEYRRALAQGKEWPDPTDYSDYQVNRRVVEINRNWGARVPKLADRLPSSHSPAKKKEEPKKAAH